LTNFIGYVMVKLMARLKVKKIKNMRKRLKKLEEENLPKSMWAG